MNKKILEKKIKNSIKHAFVKMKNNEEMRIDFIEFLKKWGCLDV